MYPKKKKKKNDPGQYAGCRPRPRGSVASAALSQSRSIHAGVDSSAHMHYNSWPSRVRRSALSVSQMWRTASARRAARTCARRQLLEVAADVAEAMAFLHQHQPAIVHRDLKSSNVLLDAAGRAVVCGARPAAARPRPCRARVPPAVREVPPARRGAPRHAARFGAAASGCDSWYRPIRPARRPPQLTARRRCAQTLASPR